MDSPNSLGFNRPHLPRPSAPTHEHLLVRHPLHRVLAFTGRSIHDVVNNPVAKNQVLGYYKLHRHIQRSSEITDLEQQWNPLGLRSRS